MYEKETQVNKLLLLCMSKKRVPRNAYLEYLCLMSSPHIYHIWLKWFICKQTIWIEIPRIFKCLIPSVIFPRTPQNSTGPPSSIHLSLQAHAHSILWSIIHLHNTWGVARPGGRYLQVSLHKNNIFVKILYISTESQNLPYCLISHHHFHKLVYMSGLVAMSLSSPSKLVSCCW